MYDNGKNTWKCYFTATWYKSFSCIHFRRSSLNIYCFYCRAASNVHCTIMSSRVDTAFTTFGFSNWKNAMSKFQEHKRSQARKDALTAYVASRSVPVSAQLQREHNKIQGQHRRSLLHQITCICYLLRQGVAVRNDHTGGSNLVVMLEQVLNERMWVVNTLIITLC